MFGITLHLVAYTRGDFYDISGSKSSVTNENYGLQRTVTMLSERLSRVDFETMPTVP